MAIVLEVHILVPTKISQRFKHATEFTDPFQIQTEPKGVQFMTCCKRLTNQLQKLWMDTNHIEIILNSEWLRAKAKHVLSRLLIMM